MKVMFATERLSHTVSTASAVVIAGGVLDGTAEPSARFTENIDNLFDCLNSKTSIIITNPQNYSYAMSANSKHLEFL